MKSRLVFAYLSIETKKCCGWVDVVGLSKNLVKPSATIEIYNGMVENIISFKIDIKCKLDNINCG